MEKAARHLNYANVMSTLAVFLAVAGGSVAIAAVPDDDSVDSKTVIDDSLKSRDLMNGEAVKSTDVVDGELGSADIATGGVTDSDILTGAVKAPQIDVGAVGEPEIAASAVESAEVATDAINSSEISSSAVGSPEILDGSITGADIGDAQVDASEVGEDAIIRTAGTEAEFEDEDGARNADLGLGEATASCRGGELISGSGKWTNSDPADDEELVISEIRLNMNTEQVTVVGGNDTGAFRKLQAEAICLDD